jgi:phosphate transport system substrate-binding protein
MKNMPSDFRASITNAAGKDAYPIASFTWVLLPETSKDPAKGKILSEFLKWMLDEGQKFAPQLSYAPLPSSVVEKARAAIQQVH